MSAEAIYMLVGAVLFLAAGGMLVLARSELKRGLDVLDQAERLLAKARAPREGRSAS